MDGCGTDLKLEIWRERRAHRYVRQYRRERKPLAVMEKPLLFDEVAELCPAGIVVIAADGRIRYTNPRAQRMLGLSREEYERRDYNAPQWRITDFEGRPQADGDLAFSRVLSEGHAVMDVEHAVERADGSRVYLRVSGQPLRGADGRIQQVIFTMMDVSATVQIERAQKILTQRYHATLEAMSEGVILRDAGGLISYCNASARRILGLREDQMVNAPQFGRCWRTYAEDGCEVPLEDRPAAVAQRTGQPCRDVCLRLENDAGRVIWVLMNAHPLFEPNVEKPYAVVCSFADISRSKQSELALRRSQQLFANAMEYAPIGMAIVGLDGRWIKVNQAVCTITGYAREELEKLSFQDITHPDDLNRDLDNVQRLVAGELPVYQMTKRYIRKDRSLVSILLSASMLRDEAGQPMHFVSQIIDLTDQHRREAELRASEERFRLMVDSVLDYEILMLDPQGTILSWNTGAERIKGYNAAEIIGRHFSCFYLPEDCTVGKPEHELRSAAREGRYEDEGWRLRKDGSRFWANVILTAIRGEDGVLRGYCKFTRDQTGRMRAETELRESRRRVDESMLQLQRQHRDMTLFAEFSGILQSCIALDELQVPIRRYARQLFPLGAGALYLMQPSRNHLEQAVHWGEPLAGQPFFTPPSCWALRRGQPHVHVGEEDLSCAHTDSSGGRLSLCIPMVAQNDTLGLLHLEIPSGESAELVRSEALAIMVAERIGMTIANLRLRESLRQQSIRDTLTQLYNRRYLEETVQRELAAAQRSGSGVAVLMIDADHFKKFNDRHGHEAGDQALRALARQLEKSCRQSDIACRYGGEEFTLVLTHVNAKQALTRAQELCDCVRAQELQLHGQPLGRITISIGVALYPAHGSDLQVLNEAADRALYQAKNSGRDRVVMSDETPQD